MSSLIVPVSTIDSIEVHPNADSLELAQVLGYQLVVQKDLYQSGDKIVYCPPDTVMPRELSDKLEITQYLGHGGRVRCARLRGEPSFGVAITPDDPTWEVGTDVAEHYGITKWEPPTRSSRLRSNGTWQTAYQDPEALPPHPLFPKYTKIENMRLYPNLFTEGEEVIITEKIHGTNSRIGIIEGEWMAGSHNVRRKEQIGNIYWRAKDHLGVCEMLTHLSRYFKQVVLYGEIYGPSIQTFDYGLSVEIIGYRAFDLLIDGKYVNWDAFAETCKLHHVETVPVLARIPYSLATVKAYSEGITTLLPLGRPTHMREGVVVKPIVERTHPKIGRLVLKYISDSYLLDRKRSDWAEE